MNHHPYFTFIICITIALLTACAGSSRKTPEIENPYISRASNHIQNGLISMQYEHWDSAERSFSRALMASELADDMQLVIQSWYNIAVIQSILHHTDIAQQAYQRVIELTQLHQNAAMQWRAKLALTLIDAHSQISSKHTSLDAFPSSLFAQNTDWPADLHLQAARLAALLEERALAKEAYRAVVLKKGSHRGLLLMKAKAHMGLALLAQSERHETTAWDEAEKSLGYCHNIGAPRLIAHALLLQGQLTNQTHSQRQDKLKRALAIYTALKDEKGEGKVNFYLRKL